MNNGKKKTTVATGGVGKKIAVGIILVAVVIMVAGVAWEGLAPKYLLAVNGEKLKEQDLMYDIYQSEGMGAQMANLYAQLGYTQDYWTMVNEDGTSTQDSLKEQTIDNYLWQRILYKEAVENGYEATEDETEEAKKAAKETIESLTEEKAKELGLTEALLTTKELEQSVIGRYKEDKIDELNIDTQKAKDSVDYDTYRGYNIEYFYAATTTTNEAGESVPVEDKTKVYDELESTLKTAKEAKDWSKVIDSEDKDALVSYKTNILTSEDETFSEDLMKKLLKMENGDTTEILEEEDGYYVFRMVNNDDPEEYDKAVDEAISTAEEDAFNEVYQKLYDEYEIKVYDKNWKNIVFGTVTLS